MTIEEKYKFICEGGNSLLGFISDIDDLNLKWHLQSKINKFFDEENNIPEFESKNLIAAIETVYNLKLKQNEKQ